ncbi:uncharacterized protein LOC144376052 isoform X1 [Ictidomys tridecemlineatus]|nr:hypothetical protein H1C71_022046 [Ictidomys tridecemlineatus]
MGVQDRRRETDTERSLVGVFQEHGQLESEERNPGPNGQRLRGREQRDKEMLSPPLTRTWRFVKGRTDLSPVSQQSEDEEKMTETAEDVHTTLEQLALETLLYISKQCLFI